VVASNRLGGVQEESREDTVCLRCKSGPDQALDIASGRTTMNRTGLISLIIGILVIIILVIIIMRLV
jgi:hypothetical protein